MHRCASSMTSLLKSSRVSLLQRASPLSSRLIASAAPPKYMILQYQYVSDILEKRAPHRAEHIAGAKAGAEEGKIVFAGAFGDQPEGALFIFKDSSEADIKQFVQADPYVKNGLVPSYTIKPYACVVAPFE